MEKKSMDISYTVRRHHRARRMRLLVYGTGHIVVSAPVRLGMKHIHAFVLKEREWIAKTLEKERLRMIPAPPLSTCRARSLKKIRDAVMRMARDHGIIVVGVRVKAMRTQWGSCTATGCLSFHYKIAFLPDALMEYVIAHELAHRKHMNHSRAFWAAVYDMVPDYQSRRQLLKQYSCA